jgi:chemotaxis protein MotA
MIGPSMAIALLTTLYGLIFSNYFFVPLSDNLLHRLYHDINLRKMIVEGVILIQQKKDPVFIREYLIVNIKPDKRNEIIMSNF